MMEPLETRVLSEPLVRLGKTEAQVLTVVPEPRERLE